MELADQVIDLGVGSIIEDSYYPPGERYRMTPEGFVQDWRVAGALVAMCETVQYSITRTKGAYVVARAKQMGYGEQPRGKIALAIVEACVAALQEGS